MTTWFRWTSSESQDPALGRRARHAGRRSGVSRRYDRAAAGYRHRRNRTGRPRHLEHIGQDYGSAISIAAGCRHSSADTSLETGSELAVELKAKRTKSCGFLPSLGTCATPEDTRATHLSEYPAGEPSGLGKGAAAVPTRARPLGPGGPWRERVELEDAQRCCCSMPVECYAVATAAPSARASWEFWSAIWSWNREDSTNPLP